MAGRGNVKLEDCEHGQSSFDSVGRSEKRGGLPLTMDISRLTKSLDMGDGKWGRYEKCFKCCQNDNFICFYRNLFNWMRRRWW
jgi:hypothetical protein